MYYLIKIWGFLTPHPLPFVIIFGTEHNQKLPFSEEGRQRPMQANTSQCKPMQANAGRLRAMNDEG